MTALSLLSPSPRSLILVFALAAFALASPCWPAASAASASERAYDRASRTTGSQEAVTSSEEWEAPPSWPEAPFGMPSSGSPMLDALRTQALANPLALNILEGLTTEIGPRLAGSPDEGRAREWAVQRLRALGFTNVRVENFTIPYWVRGTESAEIIAPYPQRLMITALGNSSATPADGITAPVEIFSSLAALKSADSRRVSGKIVFIDHRMTATQDGSSYGDAGQVRRNGPSVAARMGAAAIIIRSIGTDHSRQPHTGVQKWDDGVTPIPAAALSVADAEQLTRVAARGKPVSLRLTLTAHMAGTAQSGNVIAEIPGTDPDAGMIVIGGHLDSWDLGTGAIDDASGLAITTAAAKLASAHGRLRRTIRVVWFGAEEIGIEGGQAYAKAHAGDRIALAAESDFGADRIWRVQFCLPAAAQPLADRIGEALAPLGISRGEARAEGGSDVRPLVTAGTNAIDLSQDGTRYFDLHHTAEDSFDKIDPRALSQNVAAWTLILRLAADAPEPLLKIPSN